MSPTPVAKVLAVLDDCLAPLPDERQGAVWRLAEQGRGLDANLVRLTPGASVGEHSDDVLDVLLVVLEGSGTLGSTEGTEELGPHTVAWLPRGSRRRLQAGDEGLVYLTAHRRRPGLQVGGLQAGGVQGQGVVSAGSEGGEAACLLDRVCPECGRLATERDARFCGRCGNELP
ncbi:zinc ribbon domain-containing protein [Streptomyces triticagri]|uniref:Zinc ribbon domain-containing protein n=1 Tax=Streptomyces triticagri TaxID=2293568 RepID=A0A372M265_9ACTN|nr:zinc ribbon domain-containing protein [Streptomyces triticagri]RFU85018.1 zinc ribbon domain-containing protein [Streptomyces triticagri]